MQSLLENRKKIPCFPSKRESLQSLVYFVNSRSDSYGRFQLPIISIRSSPIKQSGTGRAPSAGVVGVVYLVRHRYGFLPEHFGHVQNSRSQGLEKPSGSDRVLRGGRVDRDTFFTIV